MMRGGETMLSFVQNLFAPKINPIGIDFGTDCLRLAQVMPFNNEHKLIAAASADVPAHIRNNASARLQFFADTARDLLAQGNFRGRQAVLAMPASGMYIQHLRLPKLDEEETRKALPWEARGKLPIDPSQALMRHLIAGEVYQDQEPKNEIIVMAAKKDAVNALLAAASRAKIDVIGMNVEPKALIDCFTHIDRRRSSGEVTHCFVDIGCASTRAVIARDGQILFARVIPIGGDHFTRAAADALKISFDEAKMKRLQCAQSVAAEATHEKTDLVVPQVAPVAEPARPDSPDNSFALLDVAIKRAEPRVEPVAAPVAVQEAAPAGTGGEPERIHQAIQEPLRKLVSELDLCRRYYEATFQNKPVEHLIFVGGEARQRAVCLQMARELGLAAQIGDPLVRMGRISEIGIETGIDRRQPQPGWAVAIGLSMGPSRQVARTAETVKQ
jgi:type IV pilus assembly protein PilM